MEQIFRHNVVPDTRHTSDHRERRVLLQRVCLCLRAVAVQTLPILLLCNFADWQTQHDQRPKSQKSISKSLA